MSDVVKKLASGEGGRLIDLIRQRVRKEKGMEQGPGVIGATGHMASCQSEADAPTVRRLGVREHLEEGRQVVEAVRQSLKEAVPEARSVRFRETGERDQALALAIEHLLDAVDGVSEAVERELGISL